MHALSQLYDLFPPFLFFFSRSISSLHLHVLIPKSLFFYPLFSCFRTAGRGWPRYPIIPFNHFNPCGMKSRTIGLHTCAAKMEILISWWAMMPMQLISKETESGRVWERERVCVCVCVCVLSVDLWMSTGKHTCILLRYIYYAITWARLETALTWPSLLAMYTL